MIVDALTLAEPVMNIARRLENPKKYLYLTDAIMEQIEASEDPVLLPCCYSRGMLVLISPLSEAGTGPGDLLPHPHA